VIGAIDRNSKYFVFKLNFASTSTLVAHVGASIEENNAYAITSDGGAGYYATGYVEQPLVKKTGL
jgi:hypothetical protein